MESATVRSESEIRIVRRQLGRVRNRLRASLAIELLAMAVIALAAAWWLLLAFDFTFELTPGFRLALILVSACVVLVWLYWSRGRALTLRLPDEQVALWIAGQAPQIADPLITAVEGKTARGPLWDSTRDWADQLATNLRPRSLVSSRRPKRWVAIAALLACSVAGFALAQPAIAGQFLRRLALSEQPWARRVRLVPEGFTQTDRGTLEMKAARGAPLEVCLRADYDQESHRPADVTLDWRGASNSRGRAMMVEQTGADAGTTRFVHRIESATENFRFWVRGGDAYLGPLSVITVPRPVLTRLDAAIVYPDYLRRAPETVAADSLQNVPEGSLLTLVGVSSKPLQEVVIDPGIGDAAIRGDHLRVELPALEQPLRIAMTLIDNDNIPSDPPFSLSVTTVPDTGPSITLRATDVVGVVTPRAVVGLDVNAADDYGLSGVTIAASVNGRRGAPIPVDGAEQQRSFRGVSRIDLASDSPSGGSRLGVLRPGDRIDLSATAVDACDLRQGQQSSTSGVLALEVVSEQQLLARIAEREANLRRVFEQTSATARKERLRLAELPSESWGDNREAVLLNTGRLEEAWRRIAQETRSASETAAAIAREVAANRVEDGAVVGRLRDQVAAPLSRIADKQVRDLESMIACATPPAECAAAAELVLDEMKSVIEQMQTIDEYNALVLSLRGLIDAQRSLEGRTEKAGKAGARSMLLD